jgi:CHAT domain-containing protein
MRYYNFDLLIEHAEKSFRARVNSPTGQATIEALQTQLRRDEYHIFHFIGHGEFDPEQQDGILLLEDEVQRGVRVNGGLLRILLNTKYSGRCIARKCACACCIISTK